jgi:glucuronoxylan 4-O-methyltransferase
MRSVNKIQIDVNELSVIINIIKRRAPCNFLIFGLGNDSLFWESINRSGKTVFLEDNEDWIQKISKQDATIRIYLIDYKSQLTQWQALLNSPHLLNIDLPREIENESWNIILVDSPEGWRHDKPGRMKSIYLASQLGKNNSDIFVHDCDRQVEIIYCDKFLKEGNFKVQVGKLRHYYLTS